MALQAVILCCNSLLLTPLPPARPWLLQRGGSTGGSPVAQRQAGGFRRQWWRQRAAAQLSGAGGFSWVPPSPPARCPPALPLRSQPKGITIGRLACSGHRRRVGGGSGSSRQRGASGSGSSGQHEGGAWRVSGVYRTGREARATRMVRRVGRGEPGEGWAGAWRGQEALRRRVRAPEGARSVHGACWGPPSAPAAAAWRHTTLPLAAALEALPPPCPQQSPCLTALASCAAWRHHCLRSRGAALQGGGGGGTGTL